MQVDIIFFLSILLIFLGIILILRVVFNIDFPALRVLSASILIFLGIIGILRGAGNWPVKTPDNDFIFNSALIDSSCELSSEYQLIFSGTVFDLTGLDLAGSQKELKINNIFSNCTVYIDPEFPLTVSVDAVFAGVKMPGRNTPIFGRGSYTSDGFDPERPHLNVSVNIVFGNIVFMRKP